MSTCHRIIGLVFVCVCISFSLVAQVAPLKLMSYNIRIASPPSKGWSTIEIDSIAAVINRNPSDLIALQEVDAFTQRAGRLSHQANDLGVLTGMHAHFAKAVDRSEGDYGVAILSKYPIKNAYAFRIDSPDPAKHEHRALAIVEVEVGGQPIIFASFHLDHLRAEVHHYQLDQVLAHLKNFEGKKLVFGADLNVPADDPLIQRLFNSGFALHQKNLHQHTFPNDKPRVTLDYLFYNKQVFDHAQNMNFEVLSQENYASDHLPIVLTVK